MCTRGCRIWWRWPLYAVKRQGRQGGDGDENASEHVERLEGAVFEPQFDERGELRDHGWRAGVEGALGPVEPDERQELQVGQVTRELVEEAVSGAANALLEPSSVLAVEFKGVHRGEPRVHGFGAENAVDKNVILRR